MLAEPKLRRRAIDSRAENPPGAPSIRHPAARRIGIEIRPRAQLDSAASGTEISDLKQPANPFDNRRSHMV